LCIGYFLQKEPPRHKDKDTLWNGKAEQEIMDRKDRQMTGNVIFLTGYDLYFMLSADVRL